MPGGLSDSKSLLWLDGQAIILDFVRTTIINAGSFIIGTTYKITSIGTTDFTLVGAADNIVGLSFIATGVGIGSGTTTTESQGMQGTSGTLTWNIPKNYTTYAGILLTSSIKEINPSNFPIDSVTYTPSSDLTLPLDMIGNAQVVGAFYNDRTTVSLNITGLVPGVPYFFSAHAISNVITYYTLGVQSYSGSQVTNTFAGDIKKSFGPPTNPFVGQVYFDETQNLVFVWGGTIVNSGSFVPGNVYIIINIGTTIFSLIGGTQVLHSTFTATGPGTGTGSAIDIGTLGWVPTSPSNTLTGRFDPIPGQLGLPPGYPALGDFFYNTNTKDLKVWSGTNWNLAETEPGTPIYQKDGVGTDLTNAARDKMIDVLKKLLGWPIVCVELLDEHFNVAIDNALQELRHRTDVAYRKQYFFMQIQRFQDTYYLNDPSAQTDKIVDVIKIHRLNMLGMTNFAPDNIYAQQFLNQFYAPGLGYDLVSIHLISAMSELYAQLFATEVAFNWNESAREMRIYKKFGTPEKVLIECSCERMEQELLSDRWTAQWIQQWAKGESCLMLAKIRGKYTSLPGPGGSLSMNYSDLISEGQSLQADCLRQINDMEIGNNGPDNFYMPFLMG